MRVTVTAVIPALNEEDNLPHVLPHIPKDVDEVVLVDGHSTDRTVEVARELLPNIKIVAQEGKGKGAALRTGFAAATGDIIVMLDADGSTDPNEIPRFVNALLAGADFVKGSRFLQGGGTSDMPIHRRLGNLAFVHMVRQLYGGKYTDLCYGYNAFWRSVVPALDLDGSGFEIETMMNIRALRAGLVVHEVPSFEAPRIVGIGRLRTIPDGWRVLRTIFSEYRREIAAVQPETRRPAMIAVPVYAASEPASLPVNGNGSALVDEHVEANGSGHAPVAELTRAEANGNGHAPAAEPRHADDRRRERPLVLAGVAESNGRRSYHSAATRRSSSDE